MNSIPKRWRNIGKQPSGTHSVSLSSLQFVEAVEDAIYRILEAPNRWRMIEEDIRRCLTHVFPYAILYTIEPEFLLIVAVMHCSREPSYWKNRVE